MPTRSRHSYLLCFALLLACFHVQAQDVKVGARIDAAQVMVGDQARLFIEAQHNPATSQLTWAAIPDTFNSLGVIEKGKIDTIKNGNIVTYKQRLLITGFDSGMFVIPQLTFPVKPSSGAAYTIHTDSVKLLVQTVPVDTTKGYKDIKGIKTVKASWLDYIWYIVGAVIAIILIAAIIIYFLRNKKNVAPVIVPSAPPEPLHVKVLRQLDELEKRKLWENNQPKEYHTELVDILRSYIEARFHVDVMESTSDEILYKAAVHKDMSEHRLLLSNILQIADLAKFAKAQPTPQEHMAAIEYARQFVTATKEKPVAPPQTPPQS